MAKRSEKAITKRQKIKTRGYGTIIAEPWTPPPAKPVPKKAKKPLDPEMAQRKIRALEKFLSDGDIDNKQYWKMKERIIADMVGGQ